MGWSIHKTSQVLETWEVFWKAGSYFGKLGGIMLIKETIVEGLRDGSGSPQRSEDYKRTARTVAK